MKTVASVATLLLSVIPLHAGEPACSPEFLSPTLYPQLGSVQNITVEDVNGDGRPDLVLDIYSDNLGIGVRLGQPDGTFGPPILSPTTWRPISLAIGEFDQGAPPGIVLGMEQAELNYHAGNGDGTFAPAVQIAPRLLYLIPPVDVNGDGKLDVVGTLPGFSGFAVHLGNGDGTFQAALDTISKEPVALEGLAVGDVTGDGKEDAVVGTFEGDVLVFPGLGNGSFQPPSVVPVGTGVGKVALAELDANGSLDIVASSDVGLVVLLNNGDGTFQAGVVYDGAPQFLVGDFDTDGEIDIASFRENGLTILRGRGDGSFETGPSFLTPYPYAASDLDDDGDLDLVGGAAINSFPSFSVTYGNGDGTFRAPRLTRSDLDTPSFQVRAASADFDEDGLPDIALGEDTTLTIYRNVGSGAFERGDRSVVGFTVLSTGDFDGDQHVDLATAVLDEVTILKGAGDGTFTPEPSIPAGPPGGIPNAIIDGDFDGDGFLDLAVAYRIDLLGALVVLRGHGDGQFDVTTIPLPASPSNLAAADLRGNGREDIGVTLFREHESLAIFLAGADGTFSEPSFYEAGTFPASIAFGDFHQTGHPDAVVGRPAEATLAWFPSLADSGSFGDPTILSVGSSMDILKSADFDQDGITDLAVSGPLAVLHGAPGGGFEAPQIYEGLYGAFFAADYDGNGFPDVALISPQIYEIGIGVLLSGRLGASVPDASAVVGSAATLEARAGGFGPLSYQWRKDGVDLSDGGSISGATTATLTIDPLSFDDAGSYDVVVTDSCGPVTSNSATLAVEFADVAPSSPFHDDILEIATAGITGGCGSGHYCPASPVRRDQMAVFLLKSEHGFDYTPPACTGVFDDVPCPGPFTDWVEQLAAEGVTGGCGVDVYCPQQSVTRAQMAVFLLKTHEGSAYTPPPAIGIFGDVPVGSFAADFVEDLYNRGITGGCSASPLLYCPTHPVLRQQMATLLVRILLP